MDLFLALALNTPTYSHAYHDATIDGLTRLTELMGLADGGSKLRLAVTASAPTPGWPQQESKACGPASNGRPRVVVSPIHLRSRLGPSRGSPST